MASYFDELFSPSNSQPTDPLSAFLSNYTCSPTTSDDFLNDKGAVSSSTSDVNEQKDLFSEVKTENEEQNTAVSSLNHNGNFQHLGLSSQNGTFTSECGSTAQISEQNISQFSDSSGVLTRSSELKQETSVECFEAHPVTSINEILEESIDESPQLNVAISNVVCSFSTKCHLNLKRIAMEGAHVIYKRENNMVNMKMRNPYCTANIWSSGKITCTGAQSEEMARIGARKVARRLQHIGFKVKFCNYRVVNVLGSCSLPFAIKLSEFAMKNPITTSYEPELHPGATYKLVDPKATIKVFSTGSITITAPSVANVQKAVEHIYPLVLPHHIPKAADPRTQFEMPYKRTADYDPMNHISRFKYRKRNEEYSSDEESYGAGSDASQD